MERCSALTRARRFNQVKDSIVEFDSISKTSKLDSVRAKRNYILFFVIFLSFLSCRKDKVQEPVVEEPTKWEVISGDYKVYDTLGVYLYDMSIEHITGKNENDEIIDSLRFINIDSSFNINYEQPNFSFSNYPKHHFYLGSHDSMLDHHGNRWDFMGLTNEIYNSLINDTIKLRFSKNNIQYYLQDIVQYEECTCIQIAVKQQ